MKPIIIEMENISESTEVYDSRPNPFFKIFIYFLLGMLLIASVWASCFHIETVVNATGIVEPEDDIQIVTNQVEASIKEVYVRDGERVKKGTLLYSLDCDSMQTQLQNVQKQHEDILEREEAIEEYIKILEGKTTNFDHLEKNQYYDLYKNKYEIITLNSEEKKSTLQNQLSSYTQNFMGYSKSLSYYNDKLIKNQQLEKCIVNNENTFSDTTDEIYYYTIVSDYLEDYNTMSCEYDFKISNGGEQYRQEKENQLRNLRDDKVMAVEQEINSIRDNISTLENEKESVATQLDGITEQSIERNNKIIVLNEVAASYSELDAYRSQESKMANNLNALKESAKNIEVHAQKDGVVNFETNISEGNYLQVGENVLTVIPEGKSDYAVLVYIPNADIGKVQCGMDVKFEIPSFSTKEYGYLTGTIKDISVSVKTSNETTGNTFYTAKVVLDSNKLVGKNGKVITLKNGMQCKGRIITEKTTILMYILNKINLHE